jgi:hypothetical protein
MSWLPFGFWMSTVGALARALIVFSPIARRSAETRAAIGAAATMFVLLVVCTVLAVRRLPPTDSPAARRAVWGIGMCGMLLAGLMVSVR